MNARDSARTDSRSVVFVALRGESITICCALRGSGARLSTRLNGLWLTRRAAAERLVHFTLNASELDVESGAGASCNENLRSRAG